MRDIINNVTIGLIEDSVELLNNYKEYFEYQEEYEVAFAFSNINEFLEQKDSINVIPQIILLDINMPGISGIDGIRLLKKEFPKVTIVMLTAYARREYILKALEYGANGYIIKGLSLNDVKISLGSYKTEGFAISPVVAKQLIEEIRKPKNEEKEILRLLTEREKDVARCISEGFTQKQTADKLGIKFNTVNHHLKNIYVKLEVNNKGSLMKKILTKIY